MKKRQMKMSDSLMGKALLFLGFLLGMHTAQGQTGTSTSSTTTTTITSESIRSQGERVSFCPHEVSVWGMGGLSTLLYSPAFGERSSQLGGGFGLGYTCYINSSLGILVGGELVFYNAKLKLDGLTDSYRTQDADKANIDYNTRLDSYEETQRLTGVNIPLMLQFQTDGENKFYAGVGFKLGIPVSGKSRIKDGSRLRASGNYYDSFNQELYDQRDLGYGLFNVGGRTADVDFKLCYMATAEAGVKWRLSRLLSLYTGLYVEYGFNDAVDTHSSSLLAYNRLSPENPQVNPALVSQYGQGVHAGSLTDHVNPFGAGLKIRLGVDLCGGGRQGEVKEVKKEVKEVKEVKEIKEVKEVKEKAAVVKKEPVREVAPAPAPVQEPAEVSQQSKRARAREMIASRASEEPEAVVEEKPIKLPSSQAKKSSEVDYNRAVSEYGNTVKGMITIELEGYELDQTTLSAKMEQVLDEKIAEIRRTYGDDIRIMCEGHTCNVGKADYNMKLGLKRANVVRDYLIRKGGYAANRVEAVTKGPNSPIVPNDTEDNRKKNRRVVLVIRSL